MYLIAMFILLAVLSHQIDKYIISPTKRIWKEDKKLFFIIYGGILSVFIIWGSVNHYLYQKDIRENRNKSFQELEKLNPDLTIDEIFDKYDLLDKK